MSNSISSLKEIKFADKQQVFDSENQILSINKLMRGMIVVLVTDKGRELAVILRSNCKSREEFKICFANNRKTEHYHVTSFGLAPYAFTNLWHPTNYILNTCQKLKSVDVQRLERRDSAKANIIWPAIDSNLLSNP